MFGAASSAHANTLNLVPQNPDIQAEFLNITYTYDSITQVGTFNVAGTSTSLDVLKAADGTVTSFKKNGTFQLTAIFNVITDATHSGANAILAPISGTLTVGGKLNVPGATPTTYFQSSQLLASGFDPGSTGTTPTFEFLFGPGIAGLLNSASNVGVVIHAPIPTFTTNYMNGGFSATGSLLTSADVYSSPLSTPLPPAALSGLACGAVIPLLRRRRR
jgi:hypothetical protein